MRGWILSKTAESALTPEKYELNRFLDAGRAQGIEMRILTPEQFDLIVTLDDRRSVVLDGEITPLPDFLIPRMGAATSYFALAVIRHLEHMGVLVVNSSSSVEAVKDKLYTQQILGANNLPIPRTMLVKHPVDLDIVAQYLGFPVVVKTLSGSQGSGVYLSPDRAHLADMMDVIDASKGSVNFILQEFIQASFGRDLRVLVVGGRAVACMQRSAVDGSFKANFSRGGAVIPYTLTPEIEWLATRTANILGLDVAGIDLLFDGDHFRICEANSSPGFKGMEQAHPTLSVPDEIFDYIRIRLGAHMTEPDTVVLPALN